MPEYFVFENLFLDFPFSPPGLSKFIFINELKVNIKEIIRKYGREALLSGIEEEEKQQRTQQASASSNRRVRPRQEISSDCENEGHYGERKNQSTRNDSRSVSRGQVAYNSSRHNRRRELRSINEEVIGRGTSRRNRRPVSTGLRRVRLRV